MKTSAKITQLIVRLGYVVLTLSIYLVPLAMTLSNFDNIDESFNNNWIIIPFYFVVPAGYVALVVIDMIMSCIKKNEIFTGKIVKLLKILSLACVYAGLVGLVSTMAVYFVGNYFIFYMLILSAGELFMALICYVLKHCFVAGGELKEENDLTI